jgi:hypothetical protein
MRTVGGAFGGQIAAAIVAHHAATGFPAESGFTTAFTMGAIAVFCAMLAATLIPARRARADAAPSGAQESERPAW